MKSVLITGTSKGIGYETALAFARAGYRVHATMRNPSKSPALAEMAAKEELQVTISAMDVDYDDSVSQGVAAIQSHHGPIDVLVNNAGVERAGSIEEQSIDDFRATMETNYFGALRCIKAVLPQMRQSRSGAIINISSVAGSFSQPPMTAYCASKWALEAMSESLACEMKAFGVRVALVKPASSIRQWPKELGQPRTRSIRTLLELHRSSPRPCRTRPCRLAWLHKRSSKSPRTAPGNYVIRSAQTQCH